MKAIVVNQRHTMKQHAERLRSHQCIETLWSGSSGATFAGCASSATHQIADQVLHIRVYSRCVFKNNNELHFLFVNVGKIYTLHHLTGHVHQRGVAQY